MTRLRFLPHLPARSRGPLAIASLILSGALVTAACATAPAPATQAPQSDDFAVVRATAEASYQLGKQQLDQGQLEQALVTLDRAAVNDPDHRADIQQALDETVQRIQAEPTEPPPTPAPTQPAPLFNPPAFTAPAPADTPIPTTAPAPAPPAPAPAPPAATAASAPLANAVQLSPWQDPQGRFRVSAPPSWQEIRAPQVPFGQGVVAFHDPTGQADLEVAVDAAPGVSPELYAAKMELQMQQLPGYALETTDPGMTGANPSFRRTFTVSQRGANGQTVNARGFQIVVMHGNTAYILSATAPAAHYQDFSSLFDSMASSLAFL